MVQPGFIPSVLADAIEVFIGTGATGAAIEGSTTLSSVVFTKLPGQSVARTFTPADVGMPIAIIGGGPIDPLMPMYFVRGAMFHTTIASYVSPSEVILTDAPDTTISNTGFNTIVVYNPADFQMDTFTADYSIAPGTRNTAGFTILSDSEYISRFEVIARGQPVYIRCTDPSFNLEFGGSINTLGVANQPGLDGVFSWTCGCVDWASIPLRRIVNPVNPAVYTNQAGDDVFKLLVFTNLIDEGVSVDADAAPSITMGAPAGAYINTLLDQVVQLISTPTQIWYWDVDPWRKFLLKKRETVMAPWDISDGYDLFAGSQPIQVLNSTSGDQLANFVYGIGSAVLANALEVTIKGDGATRVFNMPQPMQTEPTIELNGGAQTVGILGVETGKDWYWNQGSATLTQDSGGTTLAVGDLLTIDYEFANTGVAQSPNVASLQERSNVECTSGQYDYSFTISQPILPNDLLAQCTAYQQLYGVQPQAVKLSTLRPGLAVGQLQSITFPSAGVDGQFLISTVHLSTTTQVIQWDYTAFRGSNVGGGITGLVQFINRGANDLALTTPQVAITSSQAAAAVTGQNVVNQTITGVPFPNDVTKGNLLVLVAERNSVLGNPPTTTDSQGNTWTQAIFAQTGGGFPNQISLLYTFASASGPCNVVCVSGQWLALMEFSGIDSTSPVDVSGSLVGSQPTITLTDPGALVVTGVANVGVTPTVSGSEVLLGFQANGLQPGLAFSYDKPGAAGAYTSTLSTTGGGSSVWVSVAFRHQGGTAPPPQTVPVFANPSGTVTNTPTLTANLPVLGNGGVDVKVGVAGQLVPAGGSTGQVLAKLSGTDFDADWATSAAVSVTTKGDLQGFSTVPARIPVGTDGEVLTADSGAPLGVSYQPVTGGGGVTPNPASSSPTASVPFSGWSIQNQGNAHGNYNDFLPNEIVMSAGNYGTLQWSGLTRALPGATYTLIATIQVRGQLSGNVAIFAGAVCISDGTQYEQIEITLGTASANVSLNVRAMGSLSSGGTILTSSSGTAGFGLTLTVKIENNGVHRTFSYWQAGAWTQFYQELAGTFLTETEAGITGLTDVATGGYSVDVAIRYWSAM